jgi:hypothetical protein
MAFCIHASEFNPLIHTILGGPYSDSSCGGDCLPAITTTTTTTTQDPSAPTTTTTTQDPNSVAPPLVSVDRIYNLNDANAFISIQRSLDNGTSWSDWNTITSLSANSSTLFARSGGIYRARATIFGGSPSAWSFDHNYLNPDNLIPPVISVNIVLNPNNVSVFVAIQRSLDSGTSWSDWITITPLSANSSTLFATSGGIYRARLAAIGPGISVSDWSS